MKTTSTTTPNLRERANSTAQDILKIVEKNTDYDTDDITDAVEHAIIQALVEERQRCANVAFEHVCPQDRDRAHKLAEDIRQVRSVLITNLSSMR